MILKTLSELQKKRSERSTHTARRKENGNPSKTFAYFRIVKKAIFNKTLEREREKKNGNNHDHKMAKCL